MDYRGQSLIIERDIVVMTTRNQLHQLFIQKGTLQPFCPILISIRTAGHSPSRNRLLKSSGKKQARRMKKADSQGARGPQQRSFLVQPPPTVVRPQQQLGIHAVPPTPFSSLGDACLLMIDSCRISSAEVYMNKLTASRLKPSVPLFSFR